MAPSALRRQTLSELRKAFAAMMTPQWDLALEGKPKAEVTRAARTLLALQRARLRLGNAKLAGIRDKLRANEEALVEGMAAMDRSLGNLRNVRKVLQAATALLKSVGRVVDIVI